MVVRPSALIVKLRITEKLKLYDFVTIVSRTFINFRVVASTLSLRIPTD